MSVPYELLCVSHFFVCHANDAKQCNDQFEVFHSPARVLMVVSVGGDLHSVHGLVRCGLTCRSAGPFSFVRMSFVSSVCHVTIALAHHSASLRSVCRRVRSRLSPNTLCLTLSATRTGQGVDSRASTRGLFLLRPCAGSVSEGIGRDRVRGRM